MVRLIFLTAMQMILFQACSTREVRPEQIRGRYAREVDFEVPHPVTGEKLGMSKVRDTIFIAVKQNGYEISNTKWRRNDYDTLGWQNLELEENHPMPTYKVSFDPSDSTLNPELSGLFLPLKLDLKNNRLRKGKSERNVYVKVN